MILPFDLLYVYICLSNLDGSSQTNAISVLVLYCMCVCDVLLCVLVGRRSCVVKKPTPKTCLLFTSQKTHPTATPNVTVFFPQTQLPWRWKNSRWFIRDIKVLEERRSNDAHGVTFFAWEKKTTSWWFQIFFYVHPYLWEMIQFDEHIFQMGWNHQLDKVADVSPIDILANKSRHLEGHPS